MPSERNSQRTGPASRPHGDRRRAALAATMLLMAAAPTMSAGQTPSPGHVIEYRVVDSASKQPLPGVTITARMDEQTASFTTDESGRARVVLIIPDVWNLTIAFEKVGYCASKESWSPPMRGRPPQLPKAAIKELEPALTIGGRVVNAVGEPIGGVRIYPRFGGRDPDYGKRMATTDADGRWQWTGASQDVAKYPYWLAAAHPDYATMVASTDRGAFTGKELLNKTATLTMSDGVELTGRVLSNMGRPLAEASVRFRPALGPLSPETKTDKDGMYKFEHAYPGPALVVVMPKNHEAAMADVTVRPDCPPLNFAVEPGLTLVGRVVGPDGEPIPKADVRVTLLDPDTHFLVVSFWTAAARTDPQGRFAFDHFPTAGARCCVGPVRGYEGLYDGWVVPGGPGIFEVRMDRWARGGGRGQEATAQWVPKDQPPGPRPSPAPSPTPRPTPAFAPPRARVRPAAAPSSPPAPTTATPTPTPAPSIRGVVLDADGLPVGGAEVRIEPATGGKPVQSDRNGRFELLDAIGDEQSVSVQHESGFGKATARQLVDTGELRLVPWGRVEGQVILGGKPADAKWVLMRPEPQASAVPPQYLRKETNREGRFSFERLRPGPYVAGLAPGVNVFNPETLSRSVSVSVDPGQTVRVTIGTTGAMLTGRFVATLDKGRRADWYNADVWLRRLQSDGNEAASGDLAAVNARYWDTGAIAEACLRAGRDEQAWQDQVHPSADGRFKVEGVPPGEYVLVAAAKISLVDDRAGAIAAGRAETSLADSALRRGSLIGEFRVPETAARPQAVAVDLGELRVEFRKRAEAGEPAPDFAFLTLDGRPTELAAFRGKFVLLSLVRPEDRVPYRRLGEQLWEQFGRDDVLNPVTVHLCPRSDVPAKDESEPVGVIGWLGPWAASTLAGLYGVEYGSPTYLIHPDGRVLLTEVHSPAMAAGPITEYLVIRQSRLKRAAASRATASPAAPRPSPPP